MKEDLNFSGFFCDVMLGDLAKWLRILGFKVIYNNSIDDNTIVYKAIRENLIVLTKDEELSKRKNINSILIKENGPENMIEEVFRKLGLELSEKNFFRYCPICGKELEKREREEVRWFIPQRVYEEAEEFYVCTSCLKVFWKGSHFFNIKEKIENIKESLKNKK